MDSGNSGSMNSSSAGDDEYDSRAGTATVADNLSSFLHTSPFLSLPTVSLSSSTSQNLPPPTLFDPFSHSFSLDPVWPDPAQHQNYQNTLSAQFGPTSADPPPAPSSKPTIMRPDQPALGAVKNPRKRARASRRAPTTVLTTDTSNFRQMVQEFTGIPAPPFSATSSTPLPYSGRLDLFGQLYPFRPSAQKLSTTNIANAIPNFSTIATPGTTNMFSTPYNGLQNQLLSNQNLMFGSSQSTRENSLAEMGIMQDHINANLSAFLSNGKGIGRDNNGDGVRENNVTATINGENGINSWNFSQQL